MQMLLWVATCSYYFCFLETGSRGGAQVGGGGGGWLPPDNCELNLKTRYFLLCMQIASYNILQLAMEYYSSSLKLIDIVVC